MATLEKVVIKIEVDTKDLQPTVNKLKKLGLVSKKNAETFKKTSKEFQASTKKSGSILDGLSKKALALGVAMVGAFAIQQVVGSVINTLKDFEKALSELSAITGATGKDLKFLEEQAKRIGKTTTISAKEAVTAFKLMASAKPELLKAKEALAAVTDEAITLAEASGLDLPAAIEALGTTLNSMELAASEAGRVVNVLAAASKLGAKEVPFLTFALSKFGGVAKNAGEDIETAAAAIEILGKVIPQAEIVGTNLRGVFIKLQIEAAKQGRTYEGLGAELERLSSKQKDVTFLTKIFGQENLLAIQTLISQRKELGELTTAITGTNIAQEQQLVNTDNLDSSLKRLDNTWEVFILGMDDSLPVLKGAADALTGLLRAMTDAKDLIKDMRINVRLLEIALGRELTLFESAAIAVRGFNKEQIILIAQKRIQLKILDELAETQEEEIKVTEKSTTATTVAVSALKVLKKRITELKKALEEQALAGNISEKTLIEYTKAIKKAEEANKLLTDAIADQNIELIKLIDPLQQGIDAEVEGLEMVGAAQLESFEAEKTRIDIIKDKREVAINAAMELEGQLFTILANINEGKLIQIENERKAAIQAIEDRVTAGILGEDEVAEERIKITKKFDKERAKILTKQAKNDQAAAVIAAIINTAVAVTATLEIPILAALIAIAGAAEIATIIAQPIPEFHGGKRGEYSDEEINAKVLRSEYVIPSRQSRKHSAELDAMLSDKFEHFVFMKYQMPIIKQYSNIEQATFSDSAITRHQRKQTDLLITNNQLLRQMIPSMKRATHGWN